MAKQDSHDLTRSRISKTNSRILITVGIAVGVTVFSLVSIKALASKFSYQHQVLHERRLTLSTLNADKTAANSLIKQYNSVFENSNPLNIIGGKNNSSSTTLPPDGDNASIVLDSLPTSYDYPALISSVSYILSSNAITNATINGTDQSNTVKNNPTNKPTPVPIQITVGGTGSYDQFKKLINDFERSTRPFNVTSLQMTGNASSMNFSIALTTYYQPARNFATGTKEVQ